MCECGGGGGGVGVGKGVFTFKGPIIITACSVALWYS